MVEQKLRQCGQGMTEYVIIAALIAIAAIAIYGLFGDTPRGPMVSMTEDLTGPPESASLTDPKATAGSAVRGPADFSAGKR